MDLTQRTFKPAICFILTTVLCIAVRANEDAKRLYDDLMVNYNRHRRPANSPNEPLTVQLKLRLSQIIDVHELDQIMTCSVWLKQNWLDRKLAWQPESYGGVSVLYVPYEMIWVPDIVLFNNADSYYNITINTKATLHYTGKVTWEPPAIFKSLCQIDILWFPFDEQQCLLKFGSWTYPDNLLKLELMDVTTAGQRVEQIVNERGEKENITVVEDGIDLSDYYPSVEWDIMSRVARRRVRNYPPGCCPKTGVFVELYFHLALRRKPLFYTVNLVFPCVGISFLTVLVFYLPSDSGEKVSLCINILVALTMFFLLLIEIIPANSISLPFVGKYLLFTMILVTLSVLITVVSLQFHWRKPTTHTMSTWIKTVFLELLPRLLWMRRPHDVRGAFRQVKNDKGEKILFNYHDHRVSLSQTRSAQPHGQRSTHDERLHKIYNSPAVIKSFDNLCFIAELLKKKDRDNRVDEDWKYVAMVLDRLFLLIFSMVCFFGTGIILLQAPTFYDHRQPIDLQYRPEGEM
ncbi:neurotransmitter-gated ion-channel ligand binding domain-containing protein [Ditylenchus destructor]|uniref:Neurotransmitter-gated ion-channel ligand binding domain-containing protein n=1 Tax=Ditylenchus destructor TaxID=166010 RepID=A0AAD4R7G2_9BILA|nr:neurotransmitter-gated ion-channel ligand binding domain-containing protein [Ditylenchus destructor]